MKILIIASNWGGGTQDFCAKALTQLGHDVKIIVNPEKWKPFIFYNKILNQSRKIYRWKENEYKKNYNKIVLNTALEYKPDLLFTINEANTFPETLNKIKDKFKIPLVVWVADNPFDSTRFKYFPVNLKYFTHIFVGEPLWIPNIKLLAKTNIIEYLYGAVDPDIFKPVKLNDDEKAYYSAKVAFAGSAYGFKAESQYRIAILDEIGDLGLKIWGGEGWENSFGYYKNIQKAYQGRGLTLSEMNVLNQAADIILNLSNPQCLTAFQQRTFEIPASGGFQIADKRSEISKVLAEFDIDQFSSIDELRELIKFYQNHPNEKKDKVKRLQKEVCSKHTYKHRMKAIIDTIG